MIYKKIYSSPIGRIIIESDGEYLKALYFSEEEIEEANDSIFIDIIKWLDIYFSGVSPKFVPKYKIDNITPFRQSVIDEMLKIPFGSVITYNDIAKSIAKKKGISKMSSQAVGGAVGWNPICLIIPCHRVIGANNTLTGYGGGLDKKISLLQLEGHKIDIVEAKLSQSKMLLEKNS